MIVMMMKTMMMMKALQLDQTRVDQQRGGDLIMLLLGQLILLRKLMTKMHRSDPESEHSEQSSDDISKQDEGNDSDSEDTDNAHIPK
ncbi:hypothetical protein Tco_0306050, partial [Tanacetum coccineum]